MENNIKKASVKFWEDLLYFLHFMRIFVLPQISGYHHLNVAPCSMVDSPGNLNLLE